MELIIIIISILAIIIVYLMMNVNVKELERIAKNEELNEIAKKYPTNNQICKTLLNKLGNNTTKIKEDITSEATLYITFQDKIVIGNTHESFTRIQTMAHECLHSVQDRKLLIFNFVYSNIYLLYFIVVSILVILKKLPNELIYSNILLILSLIYYTVRIFLENDAMIKAEFLAKEYIEEQINVENQSKISKQEIKKLMQGFKDLNKGCIKGTNCNLFINIMIKVVIFNILALIF